MRSKAIFMALLALVCKAQAESVSVLDATVAADAWAARGRHFVLGLGQGASGEAVPHRTSNGKTFYSVKLTGGGTVFLSGDTESHPIIAFTADEADYTQIDPKSPLWALLDNDLSQRQQEARALAFSAAPSVAHAQALTKREENARKWRALLEEAESQPVRRFSLLAAPLSVDPGDLRVPMLLRTKWSQADGIWNYYTPNNAVCGCVATAAAQIMRYLHGTPDDDGAGGLEIPFPVEEVVPQTFTCQVKGKNVQLTMQGGTYCWTNMPFTAAEVKTAVQKQNIGKLTSDIGISVGMMYDELSGAGSGAYTGDVPAQWMNVFGYHQVSWIEDYAEGLEVAGDGGLDFLRNTLFANFDARRPCLLSIPSHAIVADGYGFEEDVPYVHLNMGWAGSCDLWYNLPDMTEAGEKFTAVNAIGYNVFPEIGGVDGEETTHGIVSGRVLDDDGLPVEGCAVTIRDDAGDVVTNLLTDAVGIWAAILPAGAYDVEARSDDGLWIGNAEDVQLVAPAVKVASASDAGNSGCHDITLVHPSVRLNGDDNEIFSSVDRAVKRAREIAEAAPGAPVTFELIDQTVLKRDVTLDFDCVIASTNDNPQMTAVERLRDASVTVAEGASVNVANAVFFGSAKTPFAVADGGQLVLSAGVDFGVGSDVVAVETVAPTGFVLAGPLTGALTLRCSEARIAGAAFGSYVLDEAFDAVALTNAAQLIVNVYDERREMRGAVADGGKLVWAETPCPLADAAGYIVIDGETNAFARLDRVVENLQEALEAGRPVAEVVLRKSDTLTRKLTVKTDLTIRGEGDVTVSLREPGGVTGKDVGIVVKGGLLTLEGLVFEGYDGSGSVLTVDGGALALGAGVTLRDIVGWSDHSAALFVRQGVATSAATFVNCQNNGKGNAAGGGAVTVGCSDTWSSGNYALVLTGGSITGCWARVYGGGVFAYEKASVTIGGNLTVKGNEAGTDSKSDDICIYNGEGTFKLASGGLTGEKDSVGVRWNRMNMSEGDSFVGAEGLSDEAAEDSAFALFNDADPNLGVVRSGDRRTLQWAFVPDDLQAKEPEDEFVRIVRAGSSLDGACYRRLDWALEALKAAGNPAAATLEVLKDVEFSNDLVVDFPLTLCSTGTVALTVTRKEDARIKVTADGDLCLTNVAFNCGEGKGGFLFVDGGTLTMDAGATIGGAVGSADRASGAVTVWNGATFNMLSGAAITNCVNTYWKSGSQNGYGGGVLVENNSTASFSGGLVTGCASGSGSGVFVNNGSRVNLSGDIRIAGNTSDNLRVSEDSELWVVGPLDASAEIGYTDSARSSVADANLFGRARRSSALTDVQIADAARRFRHDRTGDRGQAVRKSGATLYQLVWGAAIDGGRYTAPDGTVYLYENKGTPVRIEKPLVASDLVYNGGLQTGVPVGIGYSLTGDCEATDAGRYQATVKLGDGFVWSDGTTDASYTTNWVIAKADYDLSGVIFVTNYVYDGSEKFVCVEGTLPDGLSVELMQNPGGRVKAGTYGPVIAVFSGVDANHNAPADKDLWLVIEKAEYDLSGVVFKSQEFVYDGKPKSLVLETNSLPAGVTLYRYEGNGRIGTNASNEVFQVIAYLVGDTLNHVSPITPLTNALSIVRNPDMLVHDDEPPPPQPVEPDPIAFKSIEKVDGYWVLVATNAKQWCEYALWSGTTTKTNEWAELTDGDWKQWQETFETMTNIVPVKAGEDRRFWILKARPGVAPTP